MATCQPRRWLTGNRWWNEEEIKQMWCEWQSLVAEIPSSCAVKLQKAVNAGPWLQEEPRGSSSLHMPSVDHHSIHWRKEACEIPFCPGPGLASLVMRRASPAVLLSNLLKSNRWLGIHDKIRSNYFCTLRICFALRFYRFMALNPSDSISIHVFFSFENFLVHLIEINRLSVL